MQSPAHQVGMRPCFYQYPELVGSPSVLHLQQQLNVPIAVALDAVDGVRQQVGQFDLIPRQTQYLYLFPVFRWGY